MVYFITLQSSFVVPAIRSLVPGVFMSEPSTSLLAGEGSAGLRSHGTHGTHGTHGRLSDKETVNDGQNSCGESNKVTPNL